MTCYCCHQEKECHAVSWVDGFCLSVCTDCMPIAHKTTNNLLASIKKAQYVAGRTET